MKSEASGEPSTCIIGQGITLRISDVMAVANGGAAALCQKTRAMLAARRQEIVEFVKKANRPAYGFNRGFGHNVDVPVASENLAELQLSLIRSHSSGLGPIVPVPTVRATMLLRAHSLAQGHSGVRPEVVEAILAMLNSNVTPAVPRFGSVGASGDLAPLSHIALALMGEGECVVDGKCVATMKLFQERGLTALTLEMKEGLALNNGVQFSNALGIIAVNDLRQLLRSATLATALTSQVMLGSDSSYGEELMALRPHPGAQVIARWLRNLIKGSPLREAHRPYEVDGEIQDPYNLRCAPQILGACHELIEEAAQTFEREANSVTDNPLVLANLQDSNRFNDIVSGGHFHGMPVAIRLYSLVQSMGVMARLSNMRCVRFVDQARNKGLGSDLIWPALSDAQKSVSSGMMIPEYASAALTNEIWGLAMPSHLFSLSTDAGQEDHVSMSATLGMRVHDMLPRLSEILAIELAFAHQAAEIRKQLPTIPSKLKAAKISDAVLTKIKQIEENLAQELKSQTSTTRFIPKLDVSFTYSLTPKDRNLSPVSESALAAISPYFPKVEGDRELSTQLRNLSIAVSSGEIINAIPQEIWN